MSCEWLGTENEQYTVTDGNVSWRLIGPIKSVVRPHDFSVLDPCDHGVGVLLDRPDIANASVAFVLFPLWLTHDVHDLLRGHSEADFSEAALSLVHRAN